MPLRKISKASHTLEKGDYTHSTLYVLLRQEREEIDRHKWLESEKAGHDIGLNHAIISWGKFKQDWFQAILRDKPPHT